MKIIRTIVLAVVLVAAGVLTLISVAGQPPQQSVQNYEALVSAALSDYETNAANTENVYQQQVVAAWAAKDLLGVIGQQNAVIIDNQVEQYRAQDISQGLLRVLVIMMGLLIVAVAVIGLTYRAGGTPRVTSAAPEPAPTSPSTE